MEVLMVAMFRLRPDRMPVMMAEPDVPTKMPMGLIVRSFVSGSKKGPVDDVQKVVEVVVMDEVDEEKMRAKRNVALEVRGWVPACRRNGIAPATSRTGLSRLGFGWPPLGPKVTPKAH
jgi:hypothetical protein